MSTVTKKDLIDRIAERSGCKRVDVKKIVQCLLDEIIEDLAAGNRIEFRDFGVLETKDRAARVAQNPKTMQRVNVPRKRTVKFKVGRLLKQKLDEHAALADQADPKRPQPLPTSTPAGVVVVTKTPDRLAGGRRSDPAHEHESPEPEAHEHEAHEHESGADRS